MLRWRLLLGPIFVAVLLLLGWLDWQTAMPGLYLFPLAILLGMAATEEMLAMLQTGGLRPLKPVVYGGNLLILLSNAFPLLGMTYGDGTLHGLEWPLVAFAIGLLWVFVEEMARYEKPGGVIVNAAVAVFTLAYVGLLLSFVVQLRTLGQPDTRLGVTAVASLVWVVKLSDIGAYAVGRLIGRHKLAPRLSPGKTIEGAIGGLLFGCFGAWCVLVWLRSAMTDQPSRAPWWGWIAFGIVVGVAGMAGDLAESLIKRDTGQKDSSRWMPGFGGVLDLLDSALLAAPLAYGCWLLGIVD